MFVYKRWVQIIDAKFPGDSQLNEYLRFFQENSGSGSNLHIPWDQRKSTHRRCGMYNREEAVSPVIGVILMVAITVILAAVIAAFVFGMTGNVSKTKEVSLVAQASSSCSDAVEITNHGGKDTKSVAYFNVTVGTSKDAVPTGCSQVWLTNQTGSVGRYGGQTVNLDKVLVVATFLDGSTQVVVDTNI